MNWKDMNSLTHEEGMKLFNRIKSKLIEMELKNSWDAYVNEMKFPIFLEQAYWYMEECVKNDLHGNIDDFLYFPKVNDFYNLYDFIWEEINNIEIPKDATIYEMVEKWWDAILKGVL